MCFVDVDLMVAPVGSYVSDVSLFVLLHVFMSVFY